MTDAPPRSDDPVDAFIDKWRARWPEWQIAEVFVPAGQRLPALAWGSLQQELLDAAWGGSDPRPGDAKLAWWQEELNGWAGGARRHPLGAVLQRSAAPWRDLSAALPSLRAARERPVDADEAAGSLRPVALAMVRIDAALFAGTAVDPSAIDLALRQLQHHRVLVDAPTAVPLSVLAAVGEAGGAAEWSARLLADWPVAPAAAVPRRVHAAIVRARLQRGAAARPLPAWAALWSAWRVARN
ncbi:isoprenoid biosynthesis enzyme family protein [Cognatilysobacter tabacisoli]|uniref:phytoene/squalene synthase family protein n=1 Tax=Cognatilysobacter tabacisoli TaxID=2315424 RepID=UPI0013005F26|nr:phytoene/squalene synthase family protein [Lysobacter tabacisoli]